MKTTVLFVDDDRRVQQELEQTLGHMRQEWDLAFADSGARALAILAKTPVDVVVTDTRMPGMTGVELLESVRRQYPEVVRLFMATQSTDEAILNSVGPAHQCLPKPCDADRIVTTIRRASALKALLRDRTLLRTVNDIGRLPSPPERYFRLLRTINAPNPAITAVADIVSEDPGMTAKVLQLVNSAFFGFYRRITSAHHAASLLGLNTLSSLVLSVEVFSRYDEQSMHEMRVDDIPEHSLRVAALARDIAGAEGAKADLVEEAFTAGLLHDVGRLLFATSVEEGFRQAQEIVRAGTVSLWEAEQQTIGASHARVGAYLVGLWGITGNILEALAYHHDPSQCVDSGFSALTAVHAANVLDRHRLGAHDDYAVIDLDMAYLDRLGLSGRIDDWCALADAKASEA
jgi:HD-like signal output (HDOD) protein/CheY-like chemotaxis protein